MEEKRICPKHKTPIDADGVCSMCWLDNMDIWSEKKNEHKIREEMMCECYQSKPGDEYKCSCGTILIIPNKSVKKHKLCWNCGRRYW